MNKLKRDRGWLLSVLLLFLTVVYFMGIPYMALGWAGKQFVADGWDRTSLLFYALFSLVGAMSIVAVYRWKRWGVYGLLFTWAAIGVINIAFQTPVNIVELVLAIVLVTLFASQVRPIWPHFD